MRRFRLLIVIALLIPSGCQTLNDAVVRHWFRDPGLSRRVKHQIEQGLQRRMEAPPVTEPKPAPPFMDQG